MKAIEKNDFVTYKLVFYGLEDYTEAVHGRGIDERYLTEDEITADVLKQFEEDDIIRVGYCTEYLKGGEGMTVFRLKSITVDGNDMILLYEYTGTAS